MRGPGQKAEMSASWRGLGVYPGGKRVASISNEETCTINGLSLGLPFNA